MSSWPSPSFTGEKRYRWLTNKKVKTVEKYVKDARVLIATHEKTEIAVALNLLDAALALSPRLEAALELKARSLLYLRRFKEVAEMLKEYIPSCKIVSEDSSEISSQLLLSDNSSSDRDSSFKWFSMSNLKKKVMAGLWKNREREGQWRYLVLGQACCHLGLLEDAMVLLQTGKRLASAAFRRESVSWSDDSFSISGDINRNNPPLESVTHLLFHIKLILRRRAAALAFLETSLHSEAIRYFSKIVDSKRNMPQAFLADCYVLRADAYRAVGRIADAIADCNRSLALHPSSIQALTTRAALLESIHSYSDCLRDLDHLKLLYDTVLRDRKLPGPAWRQNGIRYCEVGGIFRALTSKMQELRQWNAAGEAPNVDYYALMGLRRGCTRSELKRAHLVLCLRHGPEKAIGFLKRCVIVDDHDADTVKEEARMSALLLYRLLQKGYSSIMAVIMDEEKAEKERKRAESTQLTVAFKAETEHSSCGVAAATSVVQGVFFRDIAVAGFNRPIPVK